MLVTATVLVPACATASSPTGDSAGDESSPDDSPADETAVEQALCPPCDQLPFLIAHGVEVSPRCVACPAPGACGDGFCDSGSGENTSTCPQDCGVSTPPSSCGNGRCDLGETVSCPQDCPCPTPTERDPNRPAPPACP